MNLKNGENFRSSVAPIRPWPGDPGYRHGDTRTGRQEALRDLLHDGLLQRFRDLVRVQGLESLGGQGEFSSVAPSLSRSESGLTICLLREIRAIHKRKFVAELEIQCHFTFSVQNCRLGLSYQLSRKSPNLSLYVRLNRKKGPLMYCPLISLLSLVALSRQRGKNSFLQRIDGADDSNFLFPGVYLLLSHENTDRFSVKECVGLKIRPFSSLRRLFFEGID